MSFFKINVIQEHHVTRAPIKHPEEAPPIPPRAPVAPPNRASVDSMDDVQLRHPSVGNTYYMPQGQQNGAGQQMRHTQNPSKYSS